MRTPILLSSPYACFLAALGAWLLLLGDAETALRAGREACRLGPGATTCLERLALGATALGFTLGTLTALLHPGRRMVAGLGALLNFILPLTVFWSVSQLSALHGLD